MNVLLGSCRVMHHPAAGRFMRRLQCSCKHGARHVTHGQHFSATEQSDFLRNKSEINPRNVLAKYENSLRIDSLGETNSSEFKEFGYSRLVTTDTEPHATLIASSCGQSLSAISFSRPAR